jgi:hypothetical protein
MAAVAEGVGLVVILGLKAEALVVGDCPLNVEHSEHGSWPTIFMPSGRSSPGGWTHSSAVNAPRLVVTVDAVAATEVGADIQVNRTVAGVVLPGVAAGVIYLVIALATGASIAASAVGGVIVAAIAFAIGFAFRAVFLRRTTHDR